MRLQFRVSKSVRIPQHMQQLVGRKLARLSLNGVLYERSQRLVRWTRESAGTLAPRDIVVRAAKEYPDFPLSSAVEAVLIELLDSAGRPCLSEQEEALLRRFALLSVSEKLRIAAKRKRTYRYLRGLPWSHHAGRKRI